MNKTLTIDTFNQITGQETLHPLITLANLDGNSRSCDLILPCDFYALICCRPAEELRLIHPGSSFVVPATRNIKRKGYYGVLFHPDLLCGTCLEIDINKYAVQRKSILLTERKRHILDHYIDSIACELHHSIDRFSSNIFVSHISLMLNYCTIFDK